MKDPSKCQKPWVGKKQTKHHHCPTTNNCVGQFIQLLFQDLTSSIDSPHHLIQHWVRNSGPLCPTSDAFAWTQSIGKGDQ